MLNVPFCCLSEARIFSFSFGARESRTLRRIKNKEKKILWTNDNMWDTAFSTFFFGVLLFLRKTIINDVITKRKGERTTILVFDVERREKKIDIKSTCVLLMVLDSRFLHRRSSFRHFLNYVTTMHDDGRMCVCVCVHEIKSKSSVSFLFENSAIMIFHSPSAL